MFAYLSDLAIGFFWGSLVSLFWTEEKIAVDLAWYLLPEYRGSGIATSMFQDFEKWAIQQGVRWCMPGQASDINVARMKGLYEHLGYKIIGMNALKELPCAAKVT